MPKSARAYWKGFLRLSLVSLPVEIYNAVESKAEIGFRQIHKPTGKRVNYTKTVPGVGEVENADIVKGYEVDEDTYVTLEPDDVDAIRLESKKTIDLVRFAKASEIDPRYFERPYLVVPADEMAGEGYVVIRDALAKTGKVGLAQITIAGREWLVAIAPLGDGLVMEMLRYAEELRDPKDFFDDVPTAKPDKEMVDLAVQLIEKKSGAFKPEQFKDHYATALRDLIQRKMRGQKIVAPHEEPARGAKIIDLMSALKKSIAEGKTTPAAAKTKASSRAAKPATKGKATAKKRA
jgi:DNA end-binding protein Ku